MGIRTEAGKVYSFTLDTLRQGAFQRMPRLFLLPSTRYQLFFPRHCQKSLLKSADTTNSLEKPVNPPCLPHMGVTTEQSSALSHQFHSLPPLPLLLWLKSKDKSFSCPEIAANISVLPLKHKKSKLQAHSALLDFVTLEKITELITWAVRGSEQDWPRWQRGDGVMNLAAAGLHWACSGNRIRAAPDTP